MLKNWSINNFEEEFGHYICECGSRTENKTGVCNYCQFLIDNNNEV